MIHTAALAIHIAAGVTGLILGPIAMVAAKRRGAHTRAGAAYFCVFVVLAASAILLAALDWAELWWLALIAVFSFAFALQGYLAARGRRPGWLGPHIAGQGGSYIAMTTALLVVNLGTTTPLAWIAPTAIGTPIISYVIYQVARGHRPKGRPDLAEARP